MRLIIFFALLMVSAAQPAWSIEAPWQYKDYCQREAWDCVYDLTQPAKVHLTPATRKLIEQINLVFNKGITSEEDEPHYHKSDYWTLPYDGKGDCEDYALAKRKALVALGLPRRAMLLTTVDSHDPKMLHAILTVRTDQGDLILDNLNDHVVRPADTGYVFLKREGQRGPEWDNLTPTLNGS